MPTMIVVRSAGLHQALSHSHPEQILPTELLIPMAAIRKEASDRDTPEPAASSGRKVKGM